MLNNYSSRELEIFINENPMVIVYFSNKHCGACEIIRNRMEEILKSYSKVKIIDIDTEEEKEIAAKYQVFSSPLQILYVNGKETIRVGRNIDFLEVEKKINRYYEMLF